MQSFLREFTRKFTRGISRGLASIIPKCNYSLYQSSTGAEVEVDFVDDPLEVATGDSLFNGGLLTGTFTEITNAMIISNGGIGGSINLTLNGVQTDLDEIIRLSNSDLADKSLLRIYFVFNSIYFSLHDSITGAVKRVVNIPVSSDIPLTILFNYDPDLQTMNISINGTSVSVASTLVSAHNFDTIEVGGLSGTTKFINATIADVSIDMLDTFNLKTRLKGIDDINYDKIIGTTNGVALDIIEGGDKTVLFPNIAIPSTIIDMSDSTAFVSGDSVNYFYRTRDFYQANFKPSLAFISYGISGYGHYDFAPTGYPWELDTAGTAPSATNSTFILSNDNPDIGYINLGPNDFIGAKIRLVSECVNIIRAIILEWKTAGKELILGTGFPLTVTDTLGVPKANDYRNQIISLGASEGLRVFDTFPIMGTDTGGGVYVLNESLSYDSLHPNEQGIINLYEGLRDFISLEPYLIDDKIQIGSACVTVPAGEAILYDIDTGEALYDKDTNEILFDKDGV